MSQFLKIEIFSSKDKYLQEEGKIIFVHNESYITFTGLFQQIRYKEHIIIIKKINILKDIIKLRHLNFDKAKIAITYIII